MRHLPSLLYISSILAAAIQSSQSKRNHDLKSIKFRRRTNPLHQIVKNRHSSFLAAFTTPSCDHSSQHRIHSLYSLRERHSHSRSHPPPRLPSGTTLHSNGDDFDIDALIESYRNNQRSSTFTETKKPTDRTKSIRDRCTHQIAIPLSTSSELTSALHSIQTSLVRECPRLIRACIMPALLRLPLLYVGGGANLFSSHTEVDAVIQRVVQDAIRREVYGIDATKRTARGINESIAVEPIVLPFRGLELQGDDNSVLYALGYNVNDETVELSSFDDEEDDGVYIVDDWGSVSSRALNGYERLEQLVKAIQLELESKHGFETCWPSDEAQGSEAEYEDWFGTSTKANKETKWRPRVPFVRLPDDFHQELQNDSRTNPDTLDSEPNDDVSEVDLLISRGFDGISPLFWYEVWGNEDIVPSPGVRMRSIAVYRKVIPRDGESESNFYEIPSSPSAGLITDNSDEMDNSDDRPYSTRNYMDLPQGDAELTTREEREVEKDLDRMGEMERRAEREWEDGKARWLESDMKEFALRDLELEDADYSQLDVSIETGNIIAEGDAPDSLQLREMSVERTEGETLLSTSEVSIATNLDLLPKEPVEETETNDISPTLTQYTHKASLERILPRMEDNPIFQRLWNGQPQMNSQGETSAQILDVAPTEEPMPPYPSDEHFVGVWRVVSSPFGVKSPSDNDSTKSSDNLVLRVDGRVMGGPIIDAQLQHKAAGGYWKMFEASRVTDDGSSDVQVTRTRLRVRLLVPPKREHVIVMEGEVTRLNLSGGNDLSSSSPDMERGGVLGVTTKSSGRAEEESLLYCEGESWIEDTETAKNRRKLGPFSLMKLKSVDRSKLIYTVPASRGGNS